MEFFHLSPKSLSYIESYLRLLVREEVERKVEAHCNLRLSSSMCSQLTDQNQEISAAVGSGTVELELRLVNKIPSTVFTGSDIEAENGEPLQVALVDITNNIIVETTRPLSSALIEFVVLDGEFAEPTQRDKGRSTRSNNVSDFDKSVLTPRAGKRPLIVGNDRKVRLKNGVAFVNSLAFTDNSSRSRSKRVRLGVRIIDEEILAEGFRIGEAVSNHFRVMDQRGQVNKKHHPPKGEDEIWRLEGIGKDGEYHKRLSSKGIENVDSFVKAYKTDPHSLKKLLGKRVSNKKWKATVNNALEYVPLPILDHPSFEQSLVENDGRFSEIFCDEFRNYDITLGDFTTFSSRSGIN